MFPLSSIFLALLGGLIPALIWLSFWLREDVRHPEPRRFIALSFVLGMVAVPLVLPFQRIAFTHITNPLWLLVAWAAIEELFKYGAAYIGGIGRRVADEPIDIVVYMISAALGFAAFENMLFLLNPLLEGNIALGILTGNIRFIGATLLHTLASGMFGAIMAFSFYRTRRIREEHLAGGLFLAIALHTVFNYFIMVHGSQGLFPVFFGVWIAIIVLIFIFEKVKRIRARRDGVYSISP